MDIKDLKINEKIIKNVQDIKHNNLTKIQEVIIPKILDNKDVLAIAQTGSGKTAAYLIPIINKIIKNKSDKLTTLIIVPTRDLVNQVYDSFLELTKNIDIKAVKIMGGTNQQTQIEQVKNNPNLIIAV